jgi:hypothetical protein
VHRFIRKTYNDKVDNAKETYVIGLSKMEDFFWEINTGLQVQKAKISYYNENGRNNQFKVPYKNKEGYALAFMESTSCMTI